MPQYIVNLTSLNDNSTTLLSNLVFNSEHTKTRWFLRNVDYTIQIGFKCIAINLSHDLVVLRDDNNITGLRLIIIGDNVSKEKSHESGFSTYEYVGMLEPYIFQHRNRYLTSLKPIMNQRGLVNISQFTFDDKEKVRYARKEAQISSLFPYLNSSPLSVLACRNATEDGMLTSFFFYQLPAGKSLAELLQLDKQSNGAYLTNEQRLKITEQIGIAMQELKDKAVIHGNINPDNIIVKDDFSCVYLINFRYSEFSHSEKRYKPLISLPYLAPELFLDDMRDMATDLFAAGIVLSELWGADPRLTTICEIETEEGMRCIWNQYLNFKVTNLFKHINDSSDSTGLFSLQKLLIKRMIEKLASFSPYVRGGADNIVACVEEARKCSSLNGNAAPFVYQPDRLSPIKSRLTMFKTASDGDIPASQAQSHQTSNDSSRHIRRSASK